jgi:hypothetical protein
MAQWADYEAEVVEAAADDPAVPDDVAEAAQDQADAMHDAADALDDAADEAAETAAEVFSDTNVPSEESSEPVVTGNPTPAWIVHEWSGPDAGSEHRVIVRDGETDYTVEHGEKSGGAWVRSPVEHFATLSEAKRRANAIRYGNPRRGWHSPAYKMGFERGEEYAGNPDEAPDSPLSGEWAGESIPEIFGRHPEDWELDDYEAGYWDAVYGNPGTAPLSVAPDRAQPMPPPSPAPLPKGNAPTGPADVAPVSQHWLHKPLIKR